MLLQISRYLLLLLIAVTGLLAFVYAIPWLDWLLGNSTPPAGAGLYAITSALAMAACIGGYAATSWLQRSRNRAALEGIRRGDALEASLSISSLLLVAVVISMFAACTWVLLQRGVWLFGAASLATTVLLLALGWQNIVLPALRPGPLLRMDADGIQHGAYGRIPWNQILGVWLERTTMRGHAAHALHLQVSNAATYLQQVPFFIRWLHWREPTGANAPATLRIPLGMLDKDAVLIHDACQVWLDRARGPNWLTDIHAQVAHVRDLALLSRAQARPLRQSSRAWNGPLGAALLVGFIAVLSLRGCAS